MKTTNNASYIKNLIWQRDTARILVVILIILEIVTLIFWRG